MKMSRLLAGAALIASNVQFAAAAPETYVIDGSHTYPRFSYNHLGFSTQLSKFNTTTGTVVLDKEARTAQVDVTIDMTSVDTGFADFNAHIQKPDFLDTAKFPTATFKSTKVEFKDDAPSALHGDLTIKGVTKPVVLTIHKFVAQPHPMKKVDAIGADASVVVKRSEFGAGMYAPAVSDEVTISIALEAFKQ
jgi:polyisoprenoid-binding protein YceI